MATRWSILVLIEQAQAIGAIRRASCPGHRVTRHYWDSFEGRTTRRGRLEPAYTRNRGSNGGRGGTLTKATLYIERIVVGIKLTRAQGDDLTRLWPCAAREATATPDSERVPARAHGESTRAKPVDDRRSGDTAPAAVGSERTRA